jgi:hypothetical protein
MLGLMNIYERVGWAGGKLGAEFVFTGHANPDALRFSSAPPLSADIV